MQMIPSRFSLFGVGGGSKVEESANGSFKMPMVKMQTDKEVYRPGDPVIVTVEIANNAFDHDSGMSLLIERLSYEVKGIQKLDTQWFAAPGRKQKRGEYVFLDCSTESLVSNHIVSSGGKRTYVAQTVLPALIPPSYKGFTIRYLYYVKSVLAGRWLVLNNGHPDRETSRSLANVEARVPIQVWVTQQTSNLLTDEGAFPATPFQMEIYWKEMDGDSEWARANDAYDGVDEGYDSSRDEISSVSSYNLTKENLHKTLGSTLSLQSSTARSSYRDLTYLEGERRRPSLSAVSQLSVSEVLHDFGGDAAQIQNSSAIVSPRQQWKHTKAVAADDDAGSSSALTGQSADPAAFSAAEGFIRGRSYNIRLDDQILLRFSPIKSDSTYYFSDMIGGTLTFFHEEGSRRCLEISITLQTSETISRRFVHPSRRNSPMLTKVQSDHHEVVTDLVQTSFLFSIPVDGPMSFSTPHVSVQWSLRFEFFTTPKALDWTRYEHPLLVEGRDKCEWVLPITVHAPPAHAQPAFARNERPVYLEPLWVRT